MAQSDMFLDRFSALVRKACSVGLRAAHALATLLLVLLVLSWLTSRGGHSVNVGLTFPLQTGGVLAFDVDDGAFAVFWGDWTNAGPADLERFTWRGLDLWRYPPFIWRLAIPLVWAALVLAPIVAAPTILRLRRFRSSAHPSNPITARSEMMTDRGVRSSVASTVRRWLAITSITASIIVAGSLLKWVSASTVLSTERGRVVALLLRAKWLELDWPHWTQVDECHDEIRGKLRANWSCWESNDPNIQKFQFPGFEFCNYYRRQSLRVRSAILLPLVALGAVPHVVHGFRRRRMAHRARNGLCLTCGYDLTGNVTGACPECGQHSSVGGFVNPPR